MKRFLTFVLALAITLTGMFSFYEVDVNAANGTVLFVESSGYEEGVYAEWAPVKGAESYKAYVSADGIEFTAIDDELIRQYAYYWRVDAIGLAEGTYYIKVEALVNGLVIAEGMTGMLTASAYDRSGFAFSSESPLGSSSGAYNDDGTLKSDAQVIYITADTVKTVEATVSGAVRTGLESILKAKRSGTDSTPIAIRVIGCVTSEDVGTESLYVRGGSDYTALNITIEGIGEDAVFYGITTKIEWAANLEIRNLGILNFFDDGISVNTNSCNIWLHNLDITYGQTGSDLDQSKGDGSIDIRRTQYCTVSYNHFWDSGKCSLLDSAALTEGYVNNITMHHNWFDHSDSRHPRIRNGNAFHIYNNYYDGNSKYGVGVTTGSSAFVEANYFRNCTYPMMSSKQGTDIISGGTFSGENGGIIKAYANYIEGQESYIPYSENAMVEFDAYEVASREELVPATVVTKQGSTSYSNFDTTQDIGVEESDVDVVEDVPAIVMKKAGRVNGGDFRWDFDDDVEDNNYDVIAALKTAVINYKTSLVSVGGTVAGNVGEMGPVEAFVLRMYEVALGRVAEEAGLNNWVTMLNAGTHDGAGIAAEFILGDEFELRGLTDEQYVDTLYQTFFGREADAEGKELWLAVLESGQTRAYVLSNFVNLAEFTFVCASYGIERGVMLSDGTAVNPGIPQFVKRQYTIVLGRDAENEGLYNNVLALVVGAETAESVAKNFFTSQEYIMKGKETSAYVTDLYSVFMNREADAAGLSFWVSCIEQYGMTRDDVLSGFAKSEEFNLIAASYGL